MPTLSRGPVPLDSYRVSYLTGFVKYFFGFFVLFSTFFVSGGVAGRAGIDSLLSLPGTHGGGWLYGVAGRAAGRAAGGRQGGGWLCGVYIYKDRACCSAGY